MAHLTVRLLPEAGLPARYVSGYLHPKPEARPGDEMVGDSHAWVEYWSGERVACDPTNRAQVGERQVIVDTGRDYGDVPPLKGIYHGAPSSTMDVTVTVARAGLTPAGGAVATAGKDAARRACCRGARWCRGRRR